MPTMSPPLVVPAPRGQRPPRIAPSAREAAEAGPMRRLTERQRDVAVLAALGASNPEIARTLYVTRRTVEFHLTSIFRTLGVTRRSQLASLVFGITAPPDAGG